MSEAIDVSKERRQVADWRVSRPGLVLAVGVVMLSLSFSVTRAQEPTQPPEDGDEHALA